MTDRRTTPANGHVALISLRGRVSADRYVTGEWSRVVVPVADLFARPDGPRDRQVLMGERLLVLERLNGYAFVQAQKDGYCGYVLLDTVGKDVPMTHWVSAPATHLYATPSIKQRERMVLSLGAKLKVIGADDDTFLHTADGFFVPRQHVLPLKSLLSDPVAVAEMMIGTPYLWGGNSRNGLDCSGLVQMAMLACGIPCPGDSDQQFAALGTLLGNADPLRRGDILFWNGHVALVADQSRIIHANAHAMSVVHENTAEAFERIAAAQGTAFLGARRI